MRPRSGGGNGCAGTGVSREFGDRDQMRQLVQGSACADPGGNLKATLQCPACTPSLQCFRQKTDMRQRSDGFLAVRRYTQTAVRDALRRRREFRLRVCPARDVLPVPAGRPSLITAGLYRQPAHITAGSIDSRRTATASLCPIFSQRRNGPWNTRPSLTLSPDTR